MTRSNASRRLPVEALRLVEAPMVDASDLPFRVMCIRGGATCTYTQMLLADKLFQDSNYRERALRDLEYEATLLTPEERTPTIVQLGGRDAETMVRAAKLFEGKCDGIDINAGCPQTRAMEGGYGSAFLVQKEWSVLENLVTGLVANIDLPISVKIRLCSPVAETIQLARRLQAAGACHITLHARFPSAKHRRHGAAMLQHVKELKDALDIPVLSNGNVRTFDDIFANLAFTSADGLMVGDALLKNPYLFAGLQPDPFVLTEEYLDLCERFNDSATLDTVQHHVKYFFERERLPKAWASIVKKRLSGCRTNEEIRHTIRELQTPLASINDC